MRSSLYLSERLTQSNIERPHMKWPSPTRILSFIFLLIQFVKTLNYPHQSIQKLEKPENSFRTFLTRKIESSKVDITKIKITSSMVQEAKTAKTVMVFNLKISNKASAVSILPAWIAAVLFSVRNRICSISISINKKDWESIVSMFINRSQRGRLRFRLWPAV